MVYDTRGEDDAGMGAVIALIDCSTSMNRAGPGGVTREVWAKALALALLQQARAGDRDFVGILFSWARNQRVYRFPAGRPIRVEDLLDFVETFDGGGTDFAAPLTLATGILAESYAADGTQRGDIVLVTDGECDVTEDWMRAWNQDRERLGFRLFGVAVDTGVGRVLDALSDNARAVTDLADVGQMADLFRII
ncbi:VWA domain-containing protein [Catenulispora yoronensis]